LSAISRSTILTKQGVAHRVLATEPRHLDLPGWRLHPLRGDLAGYWSITVSGNWRIIFRFAEGDATDVDLLDYH
jgi:toxin HigB-1